MLTNVQGIQRFLPVAASNHVRALVLDPCSDYRFVRAKTTARTVLNNVQLRDRSFPLSGFKDFARRPSSLGRSQSTVAPAPGQGADCPPVATARHTSFPGHRLGHASVFVIAGCSKPKPTGSLLNATRRERVPSCTTRESNPPTSNNSRRVCPGCHHDHRNVRPR